MYFICLNVHTTLPETDEICHNPEFSNSTVTELSEVKSDSAAKLKCVGMITL